MRREHRYVLRTGIGLLALAVLVIVGGFYDVSARAGHWSATAWLLHFTMRQSARAHSLTIDVPVLDEPERIVRGAGHYAVGCAPCHGSPADRAPRLSDHMTPDAPELAPLVDGWRLRELFWVVDNGIKYTGMPAWLTPHRPDEVWDVVAFLRVLSRLDAGEYADLVDRTRAPAARLAEAEERVFAAVLAECAICHGYDGHAGAKRAYPVLAQQNESYLRASLAAYAGAERASGTMQLMAQSLDAGLRERLARYYAAQPSPDSLAVPADDGERAALVAEGARIAAAGLPSRGVPDCNHCHGEPPVARSPMIPRLAGQPAGYLRTQLELWRDGQRGGTVYAPIMTEIADELEPREIEALAAYYAVLPRVELRETLPDGR
ncbi:MAG TPA: c-type cytochrome [Woeseiaceae bacterium]|nr:c-type cytochrome [Woeseiaceae bacterium]